MNRQLGTGLCQFQTIPGKITENIETLAKHIKTIQLHSPWVQLICAPELCLQGTIHATQLAEPIPGPTTELCAGLSRKFGVYLIPGSIYEKEDGAIYNTLPVFDPDGKIIARYRKMYPWRPCEKTKSGKETVVFEMPGVGIIGICICYDLWFPELIRDLVWKGAEIILVPTCTSTQDRRQEIILCRAAAIVNQCFIVSVNAVGYGAKGESLIVDPEGNVLQHAGQIPENLVALLDLNRVEQVRNYGTCGVSRPLTSFLHENHDFSYQGKEAEQHCRVKNIRKIVSDKIL